MSFSNYLENEVLDDIFQNADAGFNPSGTLYAALSTTTPTEAGANFTEPLTGSGYARAAVTSNSTNWHTAVNGTKGNKAAIAFNQATGDWGTVTYFGFYDQPSGGNLYAYGALTQSKSVQTNDTPSFAANSGVTITLD